MDIGGTHTAVQWCMMYTQQATNINNSTFETQESHLLTKYFGQKTSCNNINYEAEESELLGKSFETLEEAYEIYNLYALKIGFGTRKSRTRTKNNELIGKEFVCCKQGFKLNKGKQQKAYTRLDTRTGCEAMFYVENTKDNGKWVVKEHMMVHNHQFMDPRECHRLRSHRKITTQDMDFLFTLKQSGIKLIEAVRVLKGINGGSPCVGFTSKDAYNAVSEKTRSMFDGPDAHCLIQIFQKRQAEEKDFFFDFEIDDQCRLTSFFWRDARMREDYKLFNDIIIFDTTYKTNKYDMICAPFIGINNHTQNVMFGCGFLTNERIESFNWLFQVFLNAMDQIHPQTLMTDQSQSIASAIKDTFQSSAHRLCTWHLEENSRKHINHLRRRKDFTQKFQHLLRDCESEAEFDYYWNRLMEEYECKDNPWLCNLYSIRRKWCPPFTNNCFSAGILSTQRSESTNHSIKKKVHGLTSLCEFYNMFTLITKEWRSTERGRTFRCHYGKPETVLQNVPILNDALNSYTLEAFEIFENNFNKAASLYQCVVNIEHDNLTYQVWNQGNEQFPHTVKYNQINDTISCTCNKFTQNGILCYHSLRIYHINCVKIIPRQYILKRWTMKSNNYYVEQPNDTNTTNITLWKLEMARQFNHLLSASENNDAARKICEDLLQTGKQKFTENIGQLYTPIDEQELEPETMIQNPQNARIKGQSNKRQISIVKRMAINTKAKYARTKTSQPTKMM